MPPARKTQRPAETADDKEVIIESTTISKKTKKSGIETIVEVARTFTTVRRSSRNISSAVSIETTKVVEIKAKPAKKGENIPEKDIEEDNTASIKTPPAKRGASKAKKESEAESVKEKKEPKPKAQAKAGKKTTKAVKNEDSGIKEEKETDSTAVASEISPVVEETLIEEARMNGIIPVPTLKRQITDGFEIGDGEISKKEIMISSWNVNGLRAVLRKGEIQNYLKSHDIDIICFNETKIDADNLNDPEIIKNFPPEYYLYFNCCKIKKGYSGTGIATKYKPIAVQMDLNNPKHDNEGRTITLEFEKFYIISCYVPNAGDMLKRLDYRTKEWDVDFRNYIKGLKAKKHVILCGDLNVAHTEKDIYNPEVARNKYAGFTDRERQEFTNLLEDGFVDSFRELHPEEIKYSYWSLRTGARKFNNGWRLDYFVIDKEGMKGVKESSINNNIQGSDHCPIELLFNPNL